MIKLIEEFEISYRVDDGKSVTKTGIIYQTQFSPTRGALHADVEGRNGKIVRVPNNGQIVHFKYNEPEVTIETAAQRLKKEIKRHFPEYQGITE